MKSSLNGCFNRTRSLDYPFLLLIYKPFKALKSLGNDRIIGLNGHVCYFLLTDQAPWIAEDHWVDLSWRNMCALIATHERMVHIIMVHWRYNMVLIWEKKTWYYMKLNICLKIGSYNIGAPMPSIFVHHFPVYSPLVHYDIPFLLLLWLLWFWNCNATII